jgi:hypothetical protein
MLCAPSSRGSGQTGRPHPWHRSSFVVEWQGEERPEFVRRIAKMDDNGIPEAPDDERPRAVASPEMVNILSESVGQPYMNVVAWVNNVAYRKDVWLDLYGFDGGGCLMDRERLPLHYEAPAAGGGDLFGLHGIVSPDVSTLCYRIYYEVDGQMFTDGILHEATVSRE